MQQFISLDFILSEMSRRLSEENIYVIQQDTQYLMINFKYLGYCISEYKSDLEDKLQTHNKINGAIRRHFGKQMNKETKLRIHNI